MTLVEFNLRRVQANYGKLPKYKESVSTIRKGLFTLLGKIRRLAFGPRQRMFELAGQAV